MAPTHSKPSLLTLPQGLRDEIYALTFGRENRYDHFSFKKTIKNCALLLTCHQIYSEALKLYYRHSSFDFWMGDTAIKWFARLSDAKRKLVRDVRYVQTNRLWEAIDETGGWRFAPGVLKQGVRGQEGVYKNVDLGHIFEEPEDGAEVRVVRFGGVAE